MILFPSILFQIQTRNMHLHGGVELNLNNECVCYTLDFFPCVFTLKTQPDEYKLFSTGAVMNHHTWFPWFPAKPLNYIYDFLLKRLQHHLQHAGIKWPRFRTLSVMSVWGETVVPSADSLWSHVWRDKNMRYQCCFKNQQPKEMFTTFARRWRFNTGPLLLVLAWFRRSGHFLLC